MRPRALAVLLAALLAGTTLTIGTSGFSSMAADRGVEVSVAPDDSAYIGFAQTLDGGADGTTNLTVQVTNRFTETELTSVTVTVGARTVDLTPADGSLDPGEQTTGTLDDVDCGASLLVDATGEAATAQLNRTVMCDTA